MTCLASLPSDPASKVPRGLPGKAVIEPSTESQTDRAAPAKRHVSGPNVVIEDLDTFEARRRAHSKRGDDLPPEHVGSIRDPRIWRRLLSYIPPYKWQLVTAFVLSAMAAIAKVCGLFAFEKLLKPLFDVGGSEILTPFDEMVGSLAPAFASSVPSTFSFALTGLPLAIEHIWNGIPPRGQLQVAAGFMVGLVLIEQSNRYVQRLIMRSVSLDTVRIVRADLFRKLMQLSMRFFQANHSGKLLSRITSDLTNLGNLLVDVMVHILTDIFTVTLSIAYVWWRGGGVVIIALALATVSFVPIQSIARKLRKREVKNQLRLSVVFQYIQEALSAQKIVKAFVAEKHEIARFDEVNDKVTAGRMKAAKLRAQADPIVEILGSAAVAGFMIWGGSKVISGDWRGESFFAIVLALITVVASLRRLGDTNVKLQQGLSSADRISTLLYIEPEMVDAPDAVELEQFESRIDFRGVNYAHKADMPVLKNVEFTLRRGETLALVGHTGSGKSTIGDLIVRFYDVDSGAVLIDGHDVRDVSLTSLRKQMAVVTQETMLFQGTLHSNIAYARPNATRQDVIQAAKAAFAHNFISQLPLNYDTEVGERGMSLSGGERQRIAIARALLSKAPILLLDEATSALDTKSEKIVQNALDNARSDHTTIIIAHRLSTIRDSDQILVLENGRIAERGTHAELMDAAGIYADMVQLQHDS